MLPLTACKKPEIPFFEEKNDYEIQGLDEEGQSETKTYLKEVMDERFSMTPEEETEEERIRRESYQENSVRNDLIKALKAKGYYEAQINYDDREEETRSGIYKIKEGPVYTITDLRIEPDIFQAKLAAVNLKIGDTLDARAVLNAQKELYTSIQKDRCYYSMKVKHGVILKPEIDGGEVIFTVEVGPEGKFGKLTFEGNETVKDSYLRKLVKWSEGACYRAERLEEATGKLLASGLFSRAEARTPTSIEPDGEVPVTIMLKERKHRTIRAGATYYTDEGPGVVFGWQHRNFFGAGEDFNTSLKVSSRLQSLDASLKKPFFIRRDQTLNINGSITQEDTDAYENLSASAGTSLQRKFGSRLSASTGVRASLLQVEDKLTEEEETYALLSLPQNLSFDNRDDPLNAKKGIYISANGAPYFDLLGNSPMFFKTSVTASTYLPFGTERDIVLALRGKIGSILGAATASIPATERFYAGGGGSVRGFMFQSVGPHENGDPEGGRSIIEASTEVRFKITEKIGGVTFVDAASVGAEINPTFKEYSLGAGIGVRYYTNFGPLRVDLGVPITGKDNTDGAYQLYISLGQAF